MFLEFLKLYSIAYPSINYRIILSAYREIIVSLVHNAAVSTMCVNGGKEGAKGKLF